MCVCVSWRPLSLGTLLDTPNKNHSPLSVYLHSSKEGSIRFGCIVAQVKGPRSGQPDSVGSHVGGRHSRPTPVSRRSLGPFWVLSDLSGTEEGWGWGLQDVCAHRTGRRPSPPAPGSLLHPARTGPRAGEGSVPT